MSDERTPAFPVSSSEIFDDQGSTDPTAGMTLSPEVREADGCVERHTEESVREAYAPLLSPPTDMTTCTPYGRISPLRQPTRSTYHL